MNLVPFVGFTFCLLVSTISASPLLSRLGQDHSGNAVLRNVYQFPNETWVENLVVRSNSKILVTLVSAPEVWEVDPLTTPTTARFVHRLPDAIGLLGIAEYSSDVFAINVGNWSDLTSNSEERSWNVWSLDMRKQSRVDDDHANGLSQKESQEGEVSKLADIAHARFLNGMTSLLANRSTILIADSGAGTICRLDTLTGAYSIAIDNPALKANWTQNSWRERHSVSSFGPRSCLFHQHLQVTAIRPSTY